jgi:hypothetical protein
MAMNLCCSSASHAREAADTCRGRNGTRLQVLSGDCNLGLAAAGPSRHLALSHQHLCIDVLPWVAEELPLVQEGPPPLCCCLQPRLDLQLHPPQLQEERRLLSQEGPRTCQAQVWTGWWRGAHSARHCLWEQQEQGCGCATMQEPPCKG